MNKLFLSSSFVLFCVAHHLAPAKTTDFPRGYINNTTGVSAQPRSKNADETFRIFLYPFGATSQTRLAPADVIDRGSREIIIRNVLVDGCAISWRKIAGTKYYQEKDTTSDTRVVFVSSSETVSFNKEGTAGTVNGKKVVFEKNTINWFRVYIAPLTP